MIRTMIRHVLAHPLQWRDAVRKTARTHDEFVIEMRNQRAASLREQRRIARGNPLDDDLFGRAPHDD